MRIFSFSSMAVSCFLSKSSRSGSSSSSEIFDGFLFWKSFFNPSNLRLSLLRVPSSIASISSEEYLVDRSSSTTTSGASKSCFRLLRTFSRNPCRIFSNRRISLSRVLVIFNASKSSEEYRAAISSSTKSGGTSSSSS